MQVQEVISMLRWVNETDPRVMFNDAAVEVWLYALRPTDAAVAKQAILEHYKANEGIAASPAAISKRARNIAASREAGQRAIEAPAQPVKHPLSWRQRNPRTAAESPKHARVQPAKMITPDGWQREPITSLGESCRREP
jgi:hypothetical protein